MSTGTIMRKTRSEGGERATRDLRVLFLPKNSRTTYFQSFLAAARTQLNWDVQVVCAAPARRLWGDVVDDAEGFHLVPDFNKPQAWEGDPARVAEIDGWIADCEQANGVSASRIILAGERDLGRGYSQPIYYWFHNETARRVLADNTEPFRILRRMFVFVRDTLDAARPDLVLAGEWADPLCFTFHLVARQRGIACVVNRRSKILSGRCFWSSEPLMYNHAAREGALLKRQSGGTVSNRARQHIKAFREHPAMIDYVQANWQRFHPSNWLRQHDDLFRAIAVELRHHLLKEGGPPPKPGWHLLFSHYRRPWLEWRNARFFRRFDEKTLASTRYLYVTLHKDPEQTLNYQAPYWAYQMYTIGLLSSCLPYGYRLFVREHRNNPGRRPPRFYRDMAALPGVTLIDAYDDQFKYIRNADLVVTDNGSIGWEGLLFGRRLITLADAYFDGTGLERRVREPEELASIVVEMLEQPAVKHPERHDEALGWLVDAEWENSAPHDGTDHSEALDLLAALLDGRVPQAQTRAAS